MFGLPIAEAHTAADASQLALGGCLMPDDPPNWQCPNGHRWRHPDDELWNASLLAALVAHGYDPSIDAEEPVEWRAGDRPRRGHVARQRSPHCE
jgi:hypothetical protein